ncbi:MAG TPA: trypsin-like serine protease, partial [Kofleriaceae bacterium]|nr:trypsin-like serine protease [Kofleriaceae bacterium]
MIRFTPTTFAAAALLCAACTLSVPESEPEDVLGARIGESSAEVIGGTADNAFSSVCGMLVTLPPDEDGNEQDPIWCTCTLVEECTVLTSARCVNQNVEAAMGGPVTGIDVRFGNSFSEGNAFDVDFVEIYRYFSETGGNNAELALIRLAEPCPTAQPAVLIQSPLSADDVGSTLTLVGFGESIAGSENDGTRNRVDTEITTVAERYVVSGTAEATSCAGDSGGPGFIEGASGPELATINAAQGGCSASVQRIRLDRFTEDFLYPFIDRYSDDDCGLNGVCASTQCRSPDPDCDACFWQGEAGDADCAEDCPTRDWDCPLGSLTGEACEKDGDCEEGGHCVAAADDATFTYCSRECDPALMTDCPQGMTCSDTGGQSECVWPVPSPGSQGFACNAGTQCRSGICEGGI